MVLIHKFQDKSNRNERTHGQMLWGFGSGVVEWDSEEHSTIKVTGKSAMCVIERQKARISLNSGNLLMHFSLVLAVLVLGLRLLSPQRRRRKHGHTFCVLEVGCETTGMCQEDSHHVHCSKLVTEFNLSGKGCVRTKCPCGGGQGVCVLVVRT